MDHSNPIVTFKLVIIGDLGVGKTTFVKRHFNGEFKKPYIPTNGAEATSIDFSTNRGRIRFDIWDIASQMKFSNHRNYYYTDVHCAIIMFDLTSRLTNSSVARWHKDLTMICENIPIVLVGNKADVKDRKLKAYHINFHRKNNLQYYDVSAKSNYQYEKPFLWLLRKLTGDNNLYLIESPLLYPPHILMDAEHIQQLQRELEEADKLGEANLPDMENDF